MPLVGTYFQDGGRLGKASEALGVSDDEDATTGELIEALRLRVALAAAARLRSIADEALSRPNFRYATRREEVVGTIRGRLDLQRLIRSNGRLTVPPRYPVVTVERSFVTPENVLLAAALLWVRHELRLPMTRRLTARNAESVERAVAIAAIDRALAGPALHGSRAVARDRLERGQLYGLCEDVDRRLSGGHATAPAYRALLVWVQKCMSGIPAAETGEIEWSFYGKEFDTRLFEIWLLGQLRSRLLAMVGAEEAAWDFFSAGLPVDVPVTGGGRLRLVFQTSMRALRGGAAPLRWTQASGTPLGEIPDFLVALDSPSQTDTIVVDAKLRRRTGVPTEEIYKLLGYFNNFRTDGAGRGAIIFYAANPDPLVVYEFRAEDGGRVVAVSVDPERPDGSDLGWRDLLGLINFSWQDPDPNPRGSGS